MSPRPPAAVLACVLWLFPAIAAAQEGACASVFDCFCSPSAVAVVTGAATSTGEAITVATVEPPDAMGVAVGDEIPVGVWGPFQAGEMVWGIWNGSALERPLVIEDGSLACYSADPLPVQVVTDAALGMDCRGDLEAAGLTEPPCGDDTPGDGGDGSSSGCAMSAAPTSSGEVGWLWLFAVAAGLRARRVRRRR